MVIDLLKALATPLIFFAVIDALARTFIPARKGIKLICISVVNAVVAIIIGLGIAMVAMIGIAFTDYRRLVELAPFLYVFGLLLLIIVLIPHVGMKINGQRCWIKLPIAGISLIIAGLNARPACEWYWPVK